jgi:hypothetical protein
MATKVNHEVMCIIAGVQMGGNIDLEGNEDKEIVREGNREGSEPLLRLSFVDKNRRGYVKRAKKSTKPFSNQDRTSKSKKTQCYKFAMQEKEMDGTCQIIG